MSNRSIVNITGKTAFGDLMLQSAPHTALLHRQLRLYFERALNTKGALDNVSILQRALNIPANKVPELNMYIFEGNQRVYELALTLLVSRTVNELYGRTFIPAWQRPKQEDVMKAFTSKESWDGFMYENPDSLTAPVTTIPIEIKSTMIHPTKSIVSDPNQLLKDSLPQFKKYFQSEGSVCVVFVMPYSSKPNLRFDLKKATIEMNKTVDYGAIGSLCLLSLPRNDDGDTVITMNCCFVSKDPRLADSGNIDHVNITEMSFGKVTSY